MKRKRTELEEKIYNDIQLAIWKYYNSNDIKYRGKEDPANTIIDFLSYLYRLIPTIKRKVHYSKELLNKIELNEISSEHVEVLKKYADAFAEGNDMNSFLSNNIKKSQEPDFLLYTWHLFHLHMSGKFVEDINQMKNNRSDTQLLCIIDLSDVYFIDVIPHPTRAEEYFNIRSLEIIVKNGWMTKAGFYEIPRMVPGTLAPKITEDKDIFKLYSRGSVNTGFEFQGKGYYPLEPITANRRPYVAASYMAKIHRKIYELDNVEGTYKGFQLGCSDKGRLLGLVKFEAPTGEINSWNIF